MMLTTEEFGDLPDLDAKAIDDVLATDAFGKFAILSRSEEEFVQAGNDWHPGEACTEFMVAHDSDPWLLEYHESGRQLRAAEHVTLDQVRQAFRSYLAGETDWQSAFAWDELKL